MRTKGMTEAMRIASELKTLADRAMNLHRECYNAGAEERVTDMYYDVYSRIWRIMHDIEDTELFFRTGRHYDGYGTLHGLDEQTLKPLELNK